MRPSLKGADPRTFHPVKHSHALKPLLARRLRKRARCHFKTGATSALSAAVVVTAGRLSPRLTSACPVCGPRRGPFTDIYSARAWALPADGEEGGGSGAGRIAFEDASRTHRDSTAVSRFCLPRRGFPDKGRPGAPSGPSPPLPSSPPPACDASTRRIRIPSRGFRVCLR